MPNFKWLFHALKITSIRHRNPSMPRTSSKEAVSAGMLVRKIVQIDNDCAVLHQHPAVSSVVAHCEFVLLDILVNFHRDELFEQLARVEFAGLPADEFLLPGELFKTLAREEDISNRQMGGTGGIILARGCFSPFSKFTQKIVLMLLNDKRNSCKSAKIWVIKSKSSVSNEARQNPST